MIWMASCWLLQEDRLGSRWQEGAAPRIRSPAPRPAVFSTLSGSDRLITRSADREASQSTPRSPNRICRERGREPRSLVTMASAREECVYMAKLAEQAERYDEMARAGAGDWALPRARRRARRPPGPGRARAPV